MRVLFYTQDRASSADLFGMQMFLQQFPASAMCQTALSMYGLINDNTGAISNFPAVMRMQKEVALVKDEEWALVECESSSEIGSINESDEDGPSDLPSSETYDSESELGAGSDGYDVCILRRSTRLAARRDGDVAAAATAGQDSSDYAYGTSFGHTSDGDDIEGSDGVSRHESLMEKLEAIFSQVI